MQKMCLSCWKPIPLLASKCPYCLDRKQTPWGRMFFIIGVLVLSFIVYKFNI